MQPIFLAKRPGHARCISCHASGTPLRLQALAPGASGWTEEQSRKNFEVVRTKVLPGNPGKSRLLVHPLARQLYRLLERTATNHPAVDAK